MKMSTMIVALIFPFISTGGGQYLMVDEVAHRLPWQLARECCAHHGMDLAQVLSPEKNQLLSQILPLVHFRTIYYVWLGLQYHNGSTLADVNYRWVGGQLAPRDGPWSRELLQEGGSPQQCGAAMWSTDHWEWVDRPCSRTYPYVCEATDSPPAAGVPPARCPKVWTLAVFDDNPRPRYDTAREKEFSRVILTETSSWGYDVTSTTSDVLLEDCLVSCLTTPDCQRVVHLRVDDAGRCKMMKSTSATIRR